MIQITGKDKEFTVYFVPNLQEYLVYKNDKLIIRNKYKFSEIKSYLE